MNQARVLDYFAEVMIQSPTRMTPDYGWEFRGLQVADAGDHPVSVTLSRTTGSGPQDERTIRAGYVIGADGARSKARDAIGCTLDGNQANHAWGVMDVLAVTDFPDIRTKCAIQSGSGGNILLIPREGGYLFRMYVDLGEAEAGRENAVRATTIDQIITQANAILYPYRLDVKNVPWHSVYEVGHRLTSRLDDVLPHQLSSRTPHVFIAGDACHTHSAKAGQGMNVSMQDGFNLGWKLGHVIEGRSPESLLATYSAERWVIAKDLIDFDREWSALMATPPHELADPTELEDFYVRTKEFPAGFMTQYQPSMIIANGVHQRFATGFPIGKRFTSALVTRVCDGNPVHLGHHARADGRWRIYVFSGSESTSSRERLNSFARWLTDSPNSPLAATPPGLDADVWFDIKVIYPHTHGQVDIGSVPDVFLPRAGPFGLTDYEKVYALSPEIDVFTLRGVDLAGAVVNVRPDQYVANVLPLDAHEELAAFFQPILSRETKVLSPSAG